jgi:LysM repeat protein
MTPIRILAPALLAFAFVSCASQKADQYDTANPYGAADASQVNAPVTEPNPVYDTPAAYEETGATAASANPDAYIPSASPNIPAAPAAPAAASNGAAIIHTVVAGDTLSGISAKYKVPIAEIKQVNNMTRDIVVLGKKMVIPPAR